jgi:hypothetical protein
MIPNESNQSSPGLLVDHSFRVQPKELLTISTYVKQFVRFFTPSKIVVRTKLSDISLGAWDSLAQPQSSATERYACLE